MNPRIRELAEQAERLARDELAHLERVHNRLYSFTEGREIYNQKFAALIVQECIAKVEMRKKFAIEDQHIVDHAFDLLVYDLESHFGVEE